MSQHHGQTLEKVIRRGGYSISEVARLMNVNRRSVYNWFNLTILRAEIIYKIGHKMMHDFSVEYPELFKPSDFVFENNPSLSAEEHNIHTHLDEGSEWKEKYMKLHPKYQELVERLSWKEQSLTSRIDAGDRR